MSLVSSSITESIYSAGSKRLSALSIGDSNEEVSSNSCFIVFRLKLS